MTAISGVQENVIPQAETMRLNNETQPKTSINNTIKIELSESKENASNEGSTTTNAPNKLGLSRSQDDDYNAELVEHNFGSISPILPHRQRTSGMNLMNVQRTTNLRSQFRKSHTCGSFFANCNCSISPNRKTSDYTNAKNNQLQPQLSISPTLLDTSSMSSSRALTSGFYTLSAQTSTTSTSSMAQLSRDESEMSTSFDLTNAAKAVNVKQASHDINSSNKTKLAHSTETENIKKTNRTFQIPLISTTSFDEPIDKTAATISGAITQLESRKFDLRPKRIFQSYSHPDTDFIFTDENKKPSSETLAQYQANQLDTIIVTRSGKVEIKHQKRSSSPNIGHYQILDVAVHPDLVVKISPRHSPLNEKRTIPSPYLNLTNSTQQRRRLLQRSHEIESGSSNSESEHSFDNKSPTTATQNDANLTDKTPLNKSISAPIEGNVNDCNSTVRSFDDKSFNAAQKYFAESGILGPINTSTNLIRKTSKILQDSNIIEQIRKTSMILRANSITSNNSSNSSVNKTSTLINNQQATTSPTLSPQSTQLTSPTSRPLALNLTSNVNMESKHIQNTLIHSPTSSKTQKSPNKTQPPPTFATNLSTQNTKDIQIINLHDEIVLLKDVIKSRDAEILKLRREIHKLKSVLQQTTSNNFTIAHPDLLPSPTKVCEFLPSSISSSSEEINGNSQEQTCKCHWGLNVDMPSVDILNTQSIQTNTSTNEVDYSSTTSTETSTVPCSLVTKTCHENIPRTEIESEMNNMSKITATSPINSNTETLTVRNGVKVKPTTIGGLHTPVLKKQGVSGESCEMSMQQSINRPIPKYEKDFRSKQLIKEAIMDNDFLKNIDASQVRELVESMYSISIAKDEFVVREGEAGAHLYVSAEGEFEVVKNGNVLGIMGPGKAFGELAILYNCTRTASIRVLSDAQIWVLDRRVFQQIMMRTGLQRIENSVNFLRSVPLLKNLSDEVLAKIADVLEVEFYPAGTYIIRQGASGDTFFLISQGSVKVTQKLSPSVDEKEIRTLERGDYFGEQALINEDKRTANIIAMAPGVECLTLDRASFTHLIGDLCELKEKNYGDENRVLAMRYAETKEIFGANVKQEFPDMKLTDLEVVATLGIGGFGRVELVKAYQENRVDIYALKCLKKRHIVDTKQEEHVFSERTIMLTCNTPFICRLYRTFRDEKYVYMLLEACMGGEIWTMLRDRGLFDENATQFIIGCVVLAFEYLHARGIIYRDLKPENLMLDERGYVKLVDFGFAKHIGNSSKTWTFCGTPEYVAPEIILNKGHDRAVDYWALGILIHELLNGTPPFTANDPMKTYNIILKGIDMIDFPKHMSRWAVMLIKRLCRDVPAERLGYQKAGIQDIKKHKWFLGFDWDGLEQQFLIPPFVRPIAHPTDTCYFDKFPCDPNEPPDEKTGWDEGF